MELSLDLLVRYNSDRYTLPIRNWDAIARAFFAYVSNSGYTLPIRNWDTVFHFKLCGFGWFLSSRLPIKYCPCVFVCIQGTKKASKFMSARKHENLFAFCFVRIIKKNSLSRRVFRVSTTDSIELKLDNWSVFCYFMIVSRIFIGLLG